MLARKGFQYWSKLSLGERTEWMSKLRTAVLEKEHELRTAMVHEMGKNYEGANEDIEAVINALEWYPNAMKNLREEQIPDYENTHTHKMISKPCRCSSSILSMEFSIAKCRF